MNNEEEPKYKFTLTYIQTNKDGHYWSDEENTHTIKVIAKDINEAIEKMKSAGDVEYYINLQWSCEEISNI